MKKDLIIGGASNYGWNELKYWINSIRSSGFSGDVVLVATNITDETIKRLTNEGVRLQLYGKKDIHGNFVAHNNGAPHVERFFYIWNYLNEHANEYSYVITTDTRDVVFQSNPSSWIDECVFTGYQSLIASSEGLKYEDEPWGSNNLKEAFGPYFHNIYKNSLIHNVGTIAGFAEQVRDLLFMIFQMSINRPIPIVDQAVFNVLLQQKMFKDITKFTSNIDGWAIQLGTSIHAIKSGKGDIGLSVMQNPSNLLTYQMKYADEQPIITDDGYVTNSKNQKFVIVHQYDRVDGLADVIRKKYE